MSADNETERAIHGPEPGGASGGGGDGGGGGGGNGLKA